MSPWYSILKPSDVLSDNYTNPWVKKVAVPGGQRIYVAPDGQVKYSVPHANYVPNGSFVGGWYTKTVMSDCAPTTDVLDFYAVNAVSTLGSASLACGSGTDLALQTHISTSSPCLEHRRHEQHLTWYFRPQHKVTMTMNRTGLDSDLCHYCCLSDES